MTASVSRTLTILKLQEITSAVTCKKKKDLNNLQPFVLHKCTQFSILKRQRVYQLEEMQKCTSSAFSVFFITDEQNQCSSERL